MSQELYRHSRGSTSRDDIIDMISDHYLNVNQIQKLIQNVT